MMIALLLNGKIQSILPKSYIDMLVKEGRYTCRQLYDDSCDVEYDLLVGGSIGCITFDEWYPFEKGRIKRDIIIDIFENRNDNYYEETTIRYYGINSNSKDKNEFIKHLLSDLSRLYTLSLNLITEDYYSPVIEAKKEYDSFYNELLAKYSKI